MKIISTSGLPLKWITLAFVIASAIPATAATQIASQLAPAARVSSVGGGNSYDPILTPDARYVLFASTSDNLVVGTNGLPLPEVSPAHINVFLRDRQASTTVLVSINAAGTSGGNGDSFPCAISSNGQFVVFQSAASDLIPGDTNGATDIFARDIVNNITWLASISTNGAVGNGASRGAAMTPDGRYVAFVSAASNLVAGDTNGIPDVFARDLQLNTTALASAGATAVAASVSTPLTVGSSSESPVISSDGRYVAFFSSAIGLVSNVTSVGQVYLRDLVQGTTAWVSTNAHSINSSTVSANYAMSTNGQWVAYQTTGGTPPGMVFRYDAATGASDNIYTNGALVTTLDPESRKVDISADGRFVAFPAVNSTNGSSIILWDGQSGIASTISGAACAICDWPRIDQSGQDVSFISDNASLTTNSDGEIHVYVTDTSNGVVQLADVGPGNQKPISTIMAPFHFSANGGALAFDCADGALSSNPNKFDAFVRDLAANTTEVESQPALALPCATPLGLSEGTASCVSSNGQYVAFVSYSDGLASSDTNGLPDVYLHDFSTGSNVLVSVTAFGPSSGDGNSLEPSISADGRYVAFSSSATNLVTNALSLYRNVYLRDMQFGSTVLVSANAAGAGTSIGDSFAPQISADGQHVLFSSRAINLTSKSPPNGTSKYWRDIQAGVTYFIGTNFAAMTPDGSNVVFGSGDQLFLWNAESNAARVIATAESVVGDVAISPDAQWAAFNAGGEEYAADLVNSTNWTLGSVAPLGLGHFQFSGNSRFLACISDQDTGTNQVYIYDFQNSTNSLASQAFNSGGPANGPSDWPAISADGTFVAYRSAATNLVPNDNNGVPDIFLYDRITGGTTLVSASLFGPMSAGGRSLAPAFSADGQTLIFQSWASDLAAGDFNEASDVFAVSLSVNTTNAPPILGISGIGTGGVSGVSATNQTLLLSWPSIIGISYEVQFKNALSDPAWQPLLVPATIVGSHGSVIDPSPSTSNRFYRILSF
jgi:Tol biopolymer transport system component